MLPELLVSDLAGTLMLEEGAVADAYRAAFAAHDIDFTEDDILARRGASKLGVFRDLVARSYPADQVEGIARAGLEMFQSELDRAYREQPVEPIPGAGEALQSLHEAGIKLAVSSGFPRDLMLSLVERLGWAELFGTAVSGDDVPVGRPAPYIVFKGMMDLGVQDVHRVAVVGDTALDLEAGNRSGAAWVIGVLSGAHDVEKLGAIRHTHLLASVAALPELFGLWPHFSD